MTLSVRSGFTQSRASGFTLTDILVSISVVALLIGLLLPTLSSVQESAHRAVCASNIRQQGIGLIMYADDFLDLLPQSVFSGNTLYQGERSPIRMMTLRLDSSDSRYSRRSMTDLWDGLGRLHGGGYLGVGAVFYCPAHRGQNAFAEYAPIWGRDRGEIVGNYHFRGRGPNGSIYLPAIKPSSAALIADGLKTRADFNHEVGANVLRADLSTRWFEDNDRRIAGILSNAEASGEDPDIDSLWDALDQN